MHIHIANATLHFSSPPSMATELFAQAFADGAPMTTTPGKTDDSPTPPAMGEYWPGQGGHYICTLPALLGKPKRHLIVAATHFEGVTYGPNKDVPGANSHVDGAANTAALLASGHKHPAAEMARQYTADGHSDFFLPSKLDLVMAHICAKHLFKTSGWYRTSTQYSSLGAFVQDFETGYSGWHGKDSDHRVAPVREILL